MRALNIGTATALLRRPPATRLATASASALNVPDIHACFEAYVGGRWFTFDGTHTHTAGNRIVIAYGRDATDVAFVTQLGPLTLNSLKVVVEQVS